MIKIIFCDMDGTLLTSEGNLPDGFGETMAELKRRNVIFAPASGRRYGSLLRLFGEYRDDFVFIAENGTMIMHKDAELFSCSIGYDNALKILGICENLGNILRVYCGKKDAYILRDQDKPEFHAELEKYFTHRSIVDTFEEITDIPIKLSLFDPLGNTKKNIYDKILTVCESVQVILSSDYWVDVMPLFISKGSAVKTIQQIMNIKPEECAAFGDYLNDYEMLEAVDYSFAMANAHPDLKKIAKFETASNDDAGVLVGIRRLIADGLL